MTRLPRSAQLTLGFVILSLLLAFLSLVIRTLQPSDGSSINIETNDGGAYPVLARPIDLPSPLQEGDIVLKADGFDMANLTHDWINSPVHWKIGDTVQYTILRHGTTLDVPVTMKPFPVWSFLRQTWFLFAYLLLAVVITGIIFFRRPQIPMTRLLFGAFGAFCANQIACTTGLTITDVDQPLRILLFLYLGSALYPLSWAMFAHFVVIFPKPLPWFEKHRWAFAALYGSVVVAWIGSTLPSFLSSALPITQIANIVFVCLTLLYILFTPIGALVSLLTFRHDTTAMQQWRIVIFPVFIYMLYQLFIGIALPWFPLLQSPPAPTSNQYPTGVLGFFFTLISLAIPLAVGFAILRYRMWDLDVLINRTIVYGLLTLCIFSLYVGTVTLLEVVIRSRNTGGISLIATALIAILFQPVRLFLQRVVNRYLFGQRDDPYQVLTRLGQRVEATLAADAILPAIAETIAQALRLPYAAIALPGAAAPARVIAYGPPTETALTLPLIYQNETVGNLLLAPRSRGESFTPADKHLLSDLARQIGAAVHAVQLTDDLRVLANDLQRSRLQIVTAREEERRRLSGDLHDGLGSLLTGCITKLEGAVQQAGDATVTTPILAVQARLREGLDDIRRLVYNLRPPALDELGLVEALQEGLRSYDHPDLAVSLVVAEPLPPLSAVIEVTLYRAALEAVTNVVRHAQAHHCTVLLTGTNDGITLQVCDDGRGLPHSWHPGLGITALRERVDELGGTCLIANGMDGGTDLHIHIPYTEEETQ